MGKKKSDIKYAAKQVLNRTENQEIPTMDTSKSTDTLGAQILGNTMEVYIALIKIISQFLLRQSLVRKVKMVKSIRLNCEKMQNGQMVIL